MGERCALGLVVRLVVRFGLRTARACHEVELLRENHRAVDVTIATAAAHVSATGIDQRVAITPQMTLPAVMAIMSAIKDIDNPRASSGFGSISCASILMEIDAIAQLMPAANIATLMAAADSP